MLLRVELLFCLPVSNAVVERLFSMTKRIMTRLRCSLGQIRLNHLIQINLGPSLKEFDAMPAIDIWARKTTRRPNQRERKRYKCRNNQRERKWYKCRNNQRERKRYKCRNNQRERKRYKCRNNQRERKRYKCRNNQRERKRYKCRNNQRERKRYKCRNNQRERKRYKCRNNQRERKRYKCRNKDGIKVEVLIDESLTSSDGENEDDPVTLSELIEIL